MLHDKKFYLRVFTTLILAGGMLGVVVGNSVRAAPVQKPAQQDVTTDTPTDTPSISLTPTKSPKNTRTPSKTAKPTRTRKPTRTLTSTPTRTPTRTLTPAYNYQYWNTSNSHSQRAASHRYQRIPDSRTIGSGR
jgi:hypothetical protein